MTNSEFPEVLVEKEEMTVDGLAVDWIHQNIYYTDIAAFEVHMISWDGRWTRTIVTDKLDLPRAIVVSPIDGWVACHTPTHPHQHLILHSIIFDPLPTRV